MLLLLSRKYRVSNPRLGMYLACFCEHTMALCLLIKLSINQCHKTDYDIYKRQRSRCKRTGEHHRSQWQQESSHRIQSRI